MIARVLCAAALAAALAPSVAAADDGDGLRRARALLGELRYDEARAELERALGRGSAGPGELAATYLLLGEIEAATGNADAARAHFGRALALEPTLSLGQGASPKIAEPFAAAAAALKGRDPFAAHAERTAGGVAIVVDGDPARLVAGARARFRSGGDRDEVSASGSERIALALPADATELELAAVDEHGNTVAAVTPPALEPVVELVAGGGEEADASRPLHARWQLWGAVSLGLAAGGTWAGLSSRSKVGELEDLEDGTDYADALALKDQAERRALYANIAFAAAGATAITAAILYWRERDDDRGGEPARAAIAPVFGDTVGAAAMLRF